MENNNTIPKCPHLRFPEFNDEWKQTTLGRIAEIMKGSGISKNQLSPQGHPCILYGELYTKYLSEVIREIKSHTEIDPSSLILSQAGDVIIPSSGETAIDIAVARCVPVDNVALGGDLNIIRSSTTDGRFLAYQLNGAKKKEIAEFAQGVSVIHLYGRDLSKLRISLPSLPEQQKIAAFLSLLDERIEAQRQIIKERKALKHQCTQILFRNQDWPEFQFKDFLRLPQQEKYTPVSFDEILSVRLHCKGIERSKVTNLSLGATQYYKRYTGQLIYGKQNIHNGAIDLVKEEFNGGVTSKDIPSFEFYNALCHPEYFKYYLQRKNYYQKLEGLMSGTGSKRMHETTFLELTLPLPSLAEQKKIAELFTIFDERIEVEEALLACYERQKRYLLRQMFV